MNCKRCDDSGEICVRCDVASCGCKCVRPAIVRCPAIRCEVAGMDDCLDDMLAQRGYDRDGNAIK